jgi:hypothetical protein
MKFPLILYLGFQLYFPLPISPRETDPIPEFIQFRRGRLSLEQSGKGPVASTGSLHCCLRGPNYFHPLPRQEEESRGWGLALSILNNQTRLFNSSDLIFGGAWLIIPAFRDRYSLSRRPGSWLLRGAFFFLRFSIYPLLSLFQAGVKRK